jgi:hypothetical protein
MLLQVDPVQLPVEADQRAGGPADTPDPLQQPAPAAQRPGSSQMPIACSTSARRPALQRLNARCPSPSRSSVVAEPIGRRKLPRTAPAEHGLRMGIGLPAPVTTPGTDERQ